MGIVDRGDFTCLEPYESSLQPIGSGVTISAPHMHAFCLEALKECFGEGSAVLDIGSGTGIFTAYMAHLVETFAAACQY